MSDDVSRQILERLDGLDKGEQRLRTDLMARMDHLQDALSARGRDIKALLDLMVANQRKGEE